MNLLKLFLLLLTFGFFSASLANTPNPQARRLPPAIGGGQTGFMNVQRLPTSIYINGQWVLPRGGTVEKLMAMGYLPSPSNPTAFVGNPTDKRYKVPRNYYHMPSLVTAPSGIMLNVGQSPRQPAFHDPFAGVADPLKRKYTPIPGAGANPGGVNPNAGVGEPLLLPPDLDNSPFAPGIGAPGQVAPGLNQPQPIAPQAAPNPQAAQPQIIQRDPFEAVPQGNPLAPTNPQGAPQPRVDPNDPFINNPSTPENKIDPKNPNSFPGDQDRLRRLFLERQQERLRQQRDIRELQNPAPASLNGQPAQGVAPKAGFA